MTKNPMFMFSPLMRDSQQPLYKQVIDQIRKGIRMKEFIPDAPLPREVEIAAHLDVSRSVVRQAILQLVAEGILYRIPRKGTFVKNLSFEYDLLGFYNFKEEVEKQGQSLSIHLVSFQKSPVDLINSRLFNINTQDQIVEIWRTLLVNESPVLLERTTIPESFVPNITINEAKEDAFSDIFQSHGLSLAKAKKYIEPQLADLFTSKQLGISPGMPVLIIDRYTYDDFGNVIARCEWVVRGDKCRHFIAQDTLDI